MIGDGRMKKWENPEIVDLDFSETECIPYCPPNNPTDPTSGQESTTDPCNSWNPYGSGYQGGYSKQVKTGKHHSMFWWLWWF